MSNPTHVEAPTIVYAMQEEIHDLAISKGWYEDFESFSEDHIQAGEALIHSEVSEALEDLRKGRMVTDYETSGKPVGFPTEIADIVIRILDHTAAMKINLEPPCQWLRFPCATMTVKEMASTLNYVHKDICHNRWRGAIHMCYQIAACSGFDLNKQVLIKHNFNKTRSHRHGNKAL